MTLPPPPRWALLLAFGPLAACGTEEAAPVASAAPAAEAAVAATPRLPRAAVQRLVDSVDHVDYLFYDLEFSMSLDEERGIRYGLAQIDEHTTALAADCRPIGRVIYQIGGRIAAEADLYFAPGCTAFAFVGEDGAVAHVNAMSEVGKAFFNNQFAQLVDGHQPVP